MPNATKNFLGFKQVLKSTYDSTSIADKKGYIWFVRETSDNSRTEIYVGTRRCGLNFDDVYSKDDIDEAQSVIIDKINELDSTSLDDAELALIKSLNSLSVQEIINELNKED